MRRQDIRETVYRYIAEQMNCSMQDLHTGETVFIEDATKPEKYIKILSVGDTDIITLSSDMFSDGKRHLDGKSRDELYESHYVFGQTLYYVPDMNQMERLPFIEGYTYELVVADEIRKLYGIKGFDNSLSFDENGNTSTCIVLYAKKDKDIIALAGASYVNSELREVGIDVKKEFRRKKLASLLVRNLTVEILKQGKIPFYSASVTNIASQAVAIRSGYMPLWTDTFGVRDISFCK